MLEVRDEKTYEKLKKHPKYREFRKKNIIRSLLANGLLCVFWLFVLDSDNLKLSEDMRLLEVGILGLVTFFMLRFLVRALMKPKIVFETTILEIREQKRTVNETSIYGENRSRNIITHQYGVGSDVVSYWADCIEDFNQGREKKHKVGETVYFFSLGNANNYIITK